MRLAVFDPLTSFNHGLQTVLIAKYALPQCVVECVRHGQ